MAETKPKTSDSLRTPKAKKKLGLSVPPALRMPHEDLILAPAKIKPTMPSQTTLTRHSAKQDEALPASPVRDFTKVANSIGREAVPAGIFTGKSKQLYDCLYSLTRGAIMPSRTVRISRPKLMKKSSIGARVTFEANIARLMVVGLIQVVKISGEHEGNEYTVFLPEEVSMPSQSSTPSLTSPAQNLVRLDSLESSQTRHSLFVENTDTSSEAKTSFKTKEGNSDDDAALAGLNSALKTISRELTGKDLSPTEATRWTELADVLIAELKIAAARTTVSSVPSFLAEHLRRRLWKIDKKQARAEGRELPDENVTSAAPVNEAKDCPECGGSGWWYPKGTEHGVAKCKHNRAEIDQQ